MGFYVKILPFVFSLFLYVLISSCEKEPDQFQQVVIEGYVKTKGTNVPLSGVTLKLQNGAIAPFFGGGIEIIQQTKSNDQGYYKFDLKIDTHKNNHIVSDDLPANHFGYDYTNPIKLQFNKTHQRLDILLPQFSWVKIEFSDKMPFDHNECILFESFRFHGGQGSLAHKFFIVEANEKREFHFKRFARCAVFPVQRDSILVPPISGLDTVVYPIYL